jgi:anti-repressor protein
MIKVENQLTVINEQVVLGKEFRVYGDADSPLFLARDVAELIEYNQDSKGNYDTNAMLRTVDDDEKGRYVNPINNRTSLFLTEDGLYEVLMQSRKPIAKAFKKEVKKILKMIRQTGGFVAEDREVEFINNYFTSFSEDVKKAMVLDLREQNINLKQQIEEQKQQLLNAKPVLTAYEELLNSEGLFTVEEIAQDYGMSARALNKLLETNNVQYKRSKESAWVLYAKYKDKGLVKSEPYHNKHTNKTTYTTKWTSKGRIFIYGYLKNEIGIMPTDSKALEVLESVI